MRPDNEVQNNEVYLNHINFQDIDEVITSLSTSLTPHWRSLTSKATGHRVQWQSWALPPTQSCFHITHSCKELKTTSDKNQNTRYQKTKRNWFSAEFKPSRTNGHGSKNRLCLVMKQVGVDTKTTSLKDQWQEVNMMDSGKFFFLNPFDTTQG